jgi:hypothetical protein
MISDEEVQRLRFTMESVEYLDRVQDHIWQVLRERAMAKVLKEGRNVVTKDDLRACLDETILHEMREEVETARVAGR